MSEQEVERIMGAPDYAHCSMNKEGTRFLGSEWNYEIVVRVDGVNYKTNRWIESFFDGSGTLINKDAVNVNGIPNRVAL